MVTVAPPRRPVPVAPRRAAPARARGGTRNEIGASICQKPNGKIVFGPWAEGTPMSVNVPVSCPKGTKFHGIFHTHPGGVPLPSKTDLQSGERVGAQVLCINADGVVQCFERVK